MEIQNTAEETRNNGQALKRKEHTERRIGSQRATRRNGLVTTRDGLGLRTKQGALWKGGYIDEGVFASQAPEKSDRGLKLKGNGLGSVNCALVDCVSN